MCIYILRQPCHSCCLGTQEKLATTLQTAGAPSFRGTVWHHDFFWMFHPNCAEEEEEDDDDDDDADANWPIFLG